MIMYFISKIYILGLFLFLQSNPLKKNKINDSLANQKNH